MFELSRSEWPVSWGRPAVPQRVPWNHHRADSLVDVEPSGPVTPEQLVARLKELAG